MQNLFIALGMLICGAGGIVLACAILFLLAIPLFSMSIYVFKNMQDMYNKARKKRGNNDFDKS